MNPKIINADMYKKITAKGAKRKKDKNSKKYLKEKKNSLNKLKRQEKSKIKSTRKKVKLKGTDMKRVALVFTCVILLFVIGKVSRKIVKIEEIPIIKAFFNSDTNKLIKDYDLKIGVANLDTTDILKTKNLTLNEILKCSYPSLLNFNNEYEIEYKVLNSISTDDNVSYLLSINKEFKIESETIKKQIEEIMSIGSENIYYNGLKDILDIEIIDAYTMKIILKEPNPYFIYSLNFPLYNVEDKKNVRYLVADRNENSITFSKNVVDSSIKSLSVNSYDSESTLLDDFRNDKVDVFITSSESLLNLIGKYEYNLKKVRNGESIFLVGNKDSKLFSRKEVRQALAFSLNREELIKVYNNSFTEIIDLPYIYSTVKYKYDTYAAANILSASGWKKAGGVYYNKTEDGNIDLALKMLVNSSDNSKIKLAEAIKEMFEKNGIRLDVEALNDEEIAARIAEKNYDIALASINMNSSPDIRYLKEYININQNTDEAIKMIESNTDVTLTSEKIKNAEKVFSDEIACIGIVAFDNDVVYQKNIIGLDNIHFLNIFNNFYEIGKTQKID